MHVCKISFTRHREYGESFIRSLVTWLIDDYQNVNGLSSAVLKFASEKFTEKKGSLLKSSVRKLLTLILTLKWWHILTTNSLTQPSEQGTIYLGQDTVINSNSSLTRNPQVPGLLLSGSFNLEFFKLKGFGCCYGRKFSNYMYATAFIQFE